MKILLSSFIVYLLERSSGETLLIYEQTKHTKEQKY